MNSTGDFRPSAANPRKLLSRADVAAPLSQRRLLTYTFAVQAGPELRIEVGLRSSFRRRIAPVSGHHPHSLGKAGTSRLQAISQPQAGRGRAAHRDEPHIILPKLISTHLPLSLTEYADLLHQYHHTSSSDSLCDTYLCTQHLPLQANGQFFFSNLRHGKQRQSRDSPSKRLTAPSG